MVASLSFISVFPSILMNDGSSVLYSDGSEPVSFISIITCAGVAQEVPSAVSLTGDSAKNSVSMFKARKLKSFTGHTAAVVKIALFPKGIATASSDASVAVWSRDSSSQNVVCHTIKHAYPVTSLVVYQDAKFGDRNRGALLDSFGTIYSWDPATLALETPCVSHCIGGTAMCQADGSLYAVSKSIGSAFIFDSAKKKSTTFWLGAPATYITSLQMDGLFVSAHTDHSVRIWGPNLVKISIAYSAIMISSFPGVPTSLLICQQDGQIVSSDICTLFQSSRDPFVRITGIWTPKSESKIQATAVAGLESNTLAIGYSNGSVGLWDKRNRKRVPVVFDSELKNLGKVNVIEPYRCPEAKEESSGLLASGSGLLVGLDGATNNFMVYL